MKAARKLTDAFLAAHPAEASRALEPASAEAIAAVLGGNPPSIIAATLQRMDPPEAAMVLTCLPVQSAAAVLAELSPGAAALMLRSIGKSERQGLIDAVPEEIARSLHAVLSHPAETAGSIMDSNVLALPSEIRADEARRLVERRPRRAGNYVYVVDGQRRLVGAVSLAGLMLAPPGAPLASLMRSSVVRISARSSVEAILAHEGWRELHAIPVVDSSGVLIGILRRSTFERLREERGDRGAGGTGSFGLALAELAWAMTASAVDELTRAIRKEEKKNDD